MKVRVVIFVLIYCAMVAFSPMVKFCLCKNDVPPCAKSKNTKTYDLQKSCCPKSSGCKELVAKEKTCEKNKTLRCLKCTKSFYAIFQEFANITASNNLSDFNSAKNQRVCGTLDFRSSKLIKKPPGAVNLHSHIESTILRC